MLKILGGEFRSRQLRAPKDEEITRPYTARVRESVFALLRGHLDGACVLDLFAGVGTMGLEAVSRGAREVVMIERDRDVFRMLEENIERLGCGDRARAVRGDAAGEVALATAPEVIDVLFVDPPYPTMRNEMAVERIEQVLRKLSPRMHEDGWMILRTPGASLELPGWLGPEVRTYGREMSVLWYQSDRPRDDPAATEAAEL